MATIVHSSTLQLSKSTPLFSSLTYKRNSPTRFHPFAVRASDDDDPPTTAAADSTQSQPSGEPDSFETRLARLPIRNRSGTGKKAELRKIRKGKKPTSAGSGIYLPPVALKEPVSEGVKVEFGFSPFSERINGRIAILGLTALLAVELATGKSVVKYHSPAIVLIQVYFVAAVSALYLKYEKEKVSVWPR